ncbi:MAG: radical SAM protein [Candidatus Omnitrophica bacterium]|nr:radical SAM protein [Candidatus Omnitrophota bacterium]
MHNKRLNYLKVCLNYKCNFNCIYCHSCFKEDFSKDQDILNTEELAKLIDGFVRLGIEHVRIIGGEPLLRGDIFDFIYMISSTKRLKQISLTTNGFHLKEKALALKGAGLNRINIDLSSLDEGKFKAITGVDGLAKVMEGICAAKEAELSPIRINVFLIKDLNCDEIEDFAALSVLYPLDVRFIEYLPSHRNPINFSNLYVPGYMVKNKIEFSFGPLIQDKSNPNEGPAAYYRIKDAKGRIGFINLITEFLCVNCNNLVLLADGKLLPCLYSSSYVDLREPLRNYEFNLLADKIKDCFMVKPQVNKDTNLKTREGHSQYFENFD